MKPKSMTSFIAKSVTVLAACAALNASADTPAAKGPAAKNPVPPPAEPGALFDSIGATFDAGFDSRYYFRGLWFADNIMWSAFNLSVPIIGGSGEDGAGALTWGIGGAYINTAGTPYPRAGAGSPKSASGFQYSEVDAITSLNYNAGWAKFGMQYQYYFYPDNYGGSMFGAPNAGNDPEFGLKGAGELGWTVAVPIKAFNIYAGYYYDFRVNGQYISLGADYTFAVNDWLSIVPSFATGFGIDYYTGNGSGSVPTSVMTGNRGQSLNNVPTTGFTHQLYTIAVPIKLTKAVTLTTYVALNHSDRLRAALNTTQNEFYWGTKLSFAF
ncbi:hypothetical protein [Prosthecobacter sp.]|uniref:hypothetical protein n=1 Tax=Prosthecobacter sp. TaxID=1965333 RepID=UPI00378334AD